MLPQRLLITLGGHHPPTKASQRTLLCRKASSSSSATDALNRLLFLQETKEDDAAWSMVNALQVELQRSRRDAAKMVNALQGELQRSRREAAKRIRSLTDELWAAVVEMGQQRLHINAIEARNEQLEQALDDGKAKLQTSRHEVCLDT